jgi:hypothetical protein
MKLTSRDITSLRKQGADYVLEWKEKPSLDAAMRMASGRIHHTVKDSATGEPLDVIAAEHIYKGMLAAAKKK